MVTEGYLLKHGVGSILSKKANTEFTKIIRSINVETKLIREPIPAEDAD